MNTEQCEHSLKQLLVAVMELIFIKINGQFFNGNDLIKELFYP